MKIRSAVLTLVAAAATALAPFTVLAAPLAHAWNCPPGYTVRIGPGFMDCQPTGQQPAQSPQPAAHPAPPPQQPAPPPAQPAAQQPASPPAQPPPPANPPPAQPAALPPPIPPSTCNPAVGPCNDNTAANQAILGDCQMAGNCGSVSLQPQYTPGPAATPASAPVAGPPPVETPPVAPAAAPPVGAPGVVPGSNPCADPVYEAHYNLSCAIFGGNYQDNGNLAYSDGNAPIPAAPAPPAPNSLGAGANAAVGAGALLDTPPAPVLPSDSTQLAGPAQPAGMPAAPQPYYGSPLAEPGSDAANWYAQHPGQETPPNLSTTVAGNQPGAVPAAAPADVGDQPATPAPQGSSTGDQSNPRGVLFCNDESSGAMVPCPADAPPAPAPYSSPQGPCPSGATVDLEGQCPQPKPCPALPGFSALPGQCPAALEGQPAQPAQPAAQPAAQSPAAAPANGSEPVSQPENDGPGSGNCNPAKWGIRCITG